MLDVMNRNHQTLKGQTEVRQKMSILEEVVTAGECVFRDDICSKTAEGIV